LAAANDIIPDIVPHYYKNQDVAKQRLIGRLPDTKKKDLYGCSNSVAVTEQLEYMTLLAASHVLAKQHYMTQVALVTVMYWVQHRCWKSRNQVSLVLHTVVS